ncbi:uncharacterized protein LOC111107607 [Crassostrea virginica]
MVICKFFMQGNCRYGDNCKFEHPQGGNSGYAYAAQRQLFGGGGGGSRFGGGGGGGGNNPFKWSSNDYQRTQQKPASQQVSSGDLINTMIAEVKDWERNKMWPFSCIGFEKDSPCVPDFEDTSPEELRHLAYEAQKSNTFQGYVDYVQNLMADFSKKRQMLANANLRTKQKLQSIIDDYRLRKNRSGSSASYNAGSLFSSPTPSENSIQSSGFGSFGGSSTQSAFGSSGGFGSSGSTGGFGATSGSTGGFGATSGLTGGFGATSGSTGGFGATSGLTGGFGATSGSTGGFGATPGSTGGFGATSGLTGGFGATPGSTGVFGATSGSTGGFGATSGSTGGFGSSGSFGATGGFGTGTSSGATFGAQPTSASNNPFGSSNMTPFGNANLSSNPITKTPSGGFSNPGASPFGIPTQPTPGGAGATPQATAQSTTYTPLDKLTPEELAEFQATHFTLGKIPTKPPPKELCF